MYRKGLFYELQLSGSKQTVIKLSDESGSESEATVDEWADTLISKVSVTGTNSRDKW